MTRQDEIARIKATKADRRKAKGKGKATGWGGESDGSDDEDEDEWGGGDPGIFKVSPHPSFIKSTGSAGG